jgi:hypothetical protein
VKKLASFDKLVSLSLHGNDIEQADGTWPWLAIPCLSHYSLPKS